MATAPSRPRWLTLDEAGEYLQVGRNKIYEMAAAGEICGIVRVGAQWRVRPVEFFAGHGIPMPVEWQTPTKAKTLKPLTCKFFKVTRQN